MAGRAAKTVQTQRELLDPLLAEIGGTVLRDLTADDVRQGLTVIRRDQDHQDSARHQGRARARDHLRPVARQGRPQRRHLVTPPPGLSPGRPSRSLTVTQARAVLKAAEKDRLNAYFVLSMFTGIRTEEARALRWDHVDLDGPTPNVAVWRSVRAGGETKTRRSRRTLSLPERAVEALRAHREAQAKERAEMEPLELWTETGLVFTTHFGKELDAANVRRSFRRICAAAKIGENWSPRELRHTFVSIMSESGMPIEKIADLVGHTGGSRVTEQIYRQQLRPVLT
jgi:integrase